MIDGSFPGASDPVGAARGRVREVTAADALAQVEQGDVLLLDVREPAEWALGHAEGAVHVPLGQLRGRADATIPRDARILVYCASGNRSVLAADTLQELGYGRVASVKGGLRAWADAGGPIAD